MSLNWVYIAISWILLRWHELWDLVPFFTSSVTWVLSIVFLVITVRVILFPLFVKQIKSQRALQAIQPKVKELQAKHKGDRETLQKELMELYRKEKANPLMGCLPLLLQIPVFLGLFHVLRRINPTWDKKTEYGWTVDQFNSAVNARLFGAPIWASFGTDQAKLESVDASKLVVQVVAAFLVLIMVCTTYLTSRQMIMRTGWATDPQQKMIQRLMLYGVPISLLVSGALFPIGVVIYWVTTNLFSMGQQFWVLRKYPPPPMQGKTGSTARPAKSAGKKAVPAKGKGTAAKGEESPVDGKALAPKPGAKPINPKKSGAKRRARR